MKLSAIKAKALSVGVSEPAGNRTELVHQIQVSEGYSPCFRTREQCDQADCCWRADCIKELDLVV